MVKEANQFDVKAIKRRYLLRNGLFATAVGSVGLGAALLYSRFKNEPNYKALDEIKEKYPAPSSEVISQASEIKDDQKEYGCVPKEKVIWAQQKLNQKKLQDEKVAEKFPEGMTDNRAALTIGGGGSVIVGAYAGLDAMYKHEDILNTRREILKKIYYLNT